MTIEMIVSGVTIIMEVFVIGLYHCLRVKRIGWSFRILLLKPFSYVKDCRNPKECKDTFCECAFSSDIEVEHFNDWHVYALRIDKFFFETAVAIINIVSFIAFVVGVYMPAEQNY